MIKYFFVIMLWAAVLLVSACAAAPDPTPPAAPAADCACAAADWHFPFAPIAEFKDLKEPSGLVFYPGDNSLFIAGDKGHLTQMGLDGNRLKQEKLVDGANFEGITFNPETGRLYLALEGHDRIVEVDPATYEIVRQIELDRNFEGKELINPGGGGLEGIAFVPGEAGGSFYLANQSDQLAGPDPSIIIEAKIDESASPPAVKIVRYFSPGVTDLSDLTYNPTTGQLLVISDDNNLLLLLNLAGEVEQTYALPGDTQEGIAFDPAGALYIAQDAGSVLKFVPVQP